jgi:hypothetical protein
MSSRTLPNSLFFAFYAGSCKVYRNKAMEMARKTPDMAPMFVASARLLNVMQVQALKSARRMSL